MERGVITSPVSFKPLGSAGFLANHGVTRELMRYYLMYWDKVVIPRDNLFKMSTDVIREAMTLDNVESPILRFKGSFVANEAMYVMVAAQLQLAAKYKLNETVDYVLHQYNSDNVELYSPDSEQQDTLRLKLTDILPVPSEDVSFHDIMEFKHHRSDELNQLHAIVDELYIEILRSPDQSLQNRRVVSQLKQAVNDLDTVTGERFGFIKKFSTEISYSLKGEKVIGYPLASELVQMLAEGNMQQAGLMDGVSFSLATALAAAAGIASGLEYKISNRQVPNSLDGKLHLAYLVNANNDGIIRL